MWRGSRLLIPVGIVALAACGREGFEIAGGEGGDPVRFPWDPRGIVRVVATPLPPAFGDGSDGDLVVDAGNSRPTACRVLASVSPGGVLVVTTGQGAEAIAVGDRLLLHQVQGYAATSADTTPVTVLDTAGRFEVVYVESTGAALVVSPAPEFDYRTDASARAQACRIPQLRTVTISNGQIEAHPWNGWTGGVVAVFASNALAVTGGGNVSANNDGFRGGAALDSGGGYLDQDDTPQANGARKGEGIDAAGFGLSGRGNYANGAGGGMGTDGGGAGGGGYGAGGFGGRIFNDNDDTRRAFGGAPLRPAAPRLLFGGGGGAGNANGGTPAGGGAGGGAAVVFARRLSGDGDIEARASPGGGAFNNGGGGGGAGGTVLVVTESSTFDGVFKVDGGDGADANNDHGPGGGGGGGWIWVRGVESAFTVDTAGGANGNAGFQGGRGSASGGLGASQPF